MVATVEKTKTEKPTFYPTLESLMGDSPPAEGEHVYEVKTGAATKFVKSISPKEAAMSVVSVTRISQKRLLWAATQAILNRATEEASGK